MLSLATLLALPLVLVLYFLWTFLLLLFRQARSPLRHLPGPPSASLFMGNLPELHHQENTGLVARWADTYGLAFVYRGFMGGRRLMLVDPVSVNYVMSRGYDYPKPDFVRDSLASMSAGYEGLLTAEGDMHRKQRKILNQAFSAAQVKSFTPIFWEKAIRLRDIWLDVTASPQSFSTPADPLTTQDANRAADADPEPASSNTLSPSALTTSYLPNPFSSFVPSKASPRFPSTIKSRHAPLGTIESSNSPCRLDVLPWLARATLDVIGAAGFGYAFNSLEAAAERRESESELARAFAVIFGTARKFRVMTVLQVWFPVLRNFRTENAAMRQATATMRKIGMELIEQRREPVLAKTQEMAHESEKRSCIEGDKTVLGRDLLSVLIRSNAAEIPTERMSLNETLCQISTFLAAGHETSSSSLTWTLYALSRNPVVQTKLRAELRSLPVPPSLSFDSSCASPSSTDDMDPYSDFFDRIIHLPYLDAVVRESLRLFAPITTTMRVAGTDDVIPVSAPLIDRRGRTCPEIRVRRGDIISIPIQALNKSKEVWGDDAEVFRPERWTHGRKEKDEGGCGRRSAVQGLWGNMMTFGGGNPVNGNRSCIGYRFALSEIKIFLYVLVRDVEFSIDPAIEIEKKVNVLTRPSVKSEPHRGNQMPLYIRRVPLLDVGETGARI
ncbi:cytochrome P450 [Pilatotrama ljubarskyi]|nr:cytochrome P450 [Pilatotrama ljubarskyi]